MAKIKYQLEIKNPCDEQWYTMVPDSVGRFCDQCAKSVIDLTQLSDQEIIRMIASNPNGICGRAEINQLNRTLIDNANAGISSRLAKIMAAMAIIGTSGTAQANHDTNKYIETIISESKQISHSAIREKTESDTLIPPFKGRLLHESTGYPLTYLEVRITTAGFENYLSFSDSLGIFSFEHLPESVFAHDTLTFVVDGNNDNDFRTELMVATSELGKLKDYYLTESIEIRKRIQVVAGGISLIETKTISVVKKKRKKKKYSPPKN